VNSDQSSEAFLFFSERELCGVTDIYCGTGRGVIVQADEMLAAFWNSHRRFRLAANSLDKLARFVQNSAPMKTTTLPLKTSINRSSWPLAFLLIPLALACFGLRRKREPFVKTPA